MKNRLILAIVGPLVAAVGAIAVALLGSPGKSSSPTTTNTVAVNNMVVVDGREGERRRTSSSPLAGTWKGVSRLSGPEWEVVFSGNSQLQKTGAYSFSGEMTMRELGRKGADRTVVSGLVAAGTWEPTDGGYALTLTDAKSRGTVLLQPGKADIDVDRATALMQLRPTYHYEDITPRGTSQEFSVVELTATSLHSVARDLEGNVFEFQGTRER